MPDCGCCSNRGYHCRSLFCRARQVAVKLLPGRRANLSPKVSQKKLFMLFISRTKEFLVLMVVFGLAFRRGGV